MRYAIAIDLKKCFGCQTCATACKLANNLPKGICWNTVTTEGGMTIDTAAGTYPFDLHMQHLPVSCQHCTNAPCVSVCPTGATVKNENGIVTVDPEICIGCKVCMEACPYGVRRFVEDPVWAVDFPVGFADAPQHLSGTVGKCTMCSNLVEKGRVPMCVDACTGHARYFGDIEDPESEISKLLASREWHTLMPEAGTEPGVFYLD